MTAREIMTSDVVVVTPSDLMQTAAEIMRDRDIGFVAIVNDRKSMQLRGGITDRDITVQHVAAGHPRECKVHEHITAQHIQSVRPEADVRDVMDVMKRAQVLRVPVVDESGRIIGVIALADIAVKESCERPEQLVAAVEKLSEPGRA